MSEGFGFILGSWVTTADGQDVGRIVEVSNGFFKVNAPLQDEYWLSSDALASHTKRYVKLHLTKEDLEQAKHENPSRTRVHYR